MIILITIAFLVLTSLALFYPIRETNNSAPGNFEECVSAGNPIGESYPRQCTANGKTFYEELDGKKYISHSLEQCETVRFACEPDRKPFFDETGCGCKKTDLEDYFVEQIWKIGTKNLGAMPIEGFNPELYKGAFPMLEDYDFHDTEAYGGVWKYQNEKLEFVRDNSQGITSADGTLTEEGVKKLYNNLKIRMDFILESPEDIDSLLDFLSGEKKQNFCSPESRNAEACTMDYNPVCGYVQVECITTPCNPVPETFSNSCVACSNEDVLYWTQGECLTS